MKICHVVCLLCVATYRLNLFKSTTTKCSNCKQIKIHLNCWPPPKKAQRFPILVREDRTSDHTEHPSPTEPEVPVVFDQWGAGSSRGETSVWFSTGATYNIGGWALPLPLGRLLYLTQHISIPWPLAMFLSWQGAFSHIWEAYFDRYLEFPSFPEPGKIDISGSPLGSGSSARLDGRMREVVLPKVSGQGCSLGCQSYICSPNLDHILKVLFGPYQKNKIVLTKLSRLGYVSKPLR